MVSSKSLPPSSTAVPGVKLNITLITLSPSINDTDLSNLPLESLPSICFKARTQRCVHVFLVTDPYEVEIPGYFSASPGWPTREGQAIVIEQLQAGVQYQFMVAGKHEFPNDTLAIELRGQECAISAQPGAPPCPSPELPNMRWLGPAQCFRPGPDGCTFTSQAELIRQGITCSNTRQDTCLAQNPAETRNWNWFRMLQYTPRGIEIGNTYSVAFQGVAPGAFSSASGAPLAAFTSQGIAFGAQLASQFGGPPGVSATFSCTGPLASFAEYLSASASNTFGYYRFTITPNTDFDFDYTQGQQPLLDPAAGGAPFAPPRTSAEPADAAIGSVTVYPNCPTRVGYYAKQPGTAIAATAGLAALPGAAFVAGAAYPCLVAEGQLCPYAEIQWRPASAAAKAGSLSGGNGEPNNSLSAVSVTAALALPPPMPPASGKCF